MLTGRLIRGPGLTEIALDDVPLEDLRRHLPPEGWKGIESARETAAAVLAGRTVWNVNSTALGGGVAEMSRTLLPYWRSGGVTTRWLVASGPPSYFLHTKRVHNMLHGVPGSPLGLDAHGAFDLHARSVGAQLAAVVSPGDFVILHDPQTAALAAPARRAGATVVWRCHVGADAPSRSSEAAWRFLLPYVAYADAFVFTRAEYVPPELRGRRLWICAPAIDPCSAKNRPLGRDSALGLLARAGFLAGSGATAGAPGARARILRLGDGLRLDRDRVVLAIARWDRLKDAAGVMRMFASDVGGEHTRLVVAGPEVAAVADDPEGPAVLAEVRRGWQTLPRAARARIQVAALPMRDLEENALVVNALQRTAAVVVKKSLQEGFGLGVTEAMWKAKPVVASAVGGHLDQIEHRRTGLLVRDPADGPACAAAVNELLRDPGEALRLGPAARESVRRRFLADRHFEDWVATLAALSPR